MPLENRTERKPNRCRSGVVGTDLARENGGIRRYSQTKLSSNDVTIDLASVDIGSDKFDDELRKENFFDVAKYPTAEYKVGLAEWREARRGVGTSVNKGLRNSQIQYGIGISSGSESRP